jgi:hypothetical protein
VISPPARAEQVERAVRARRKGALAAYRDATLFKVMYGWGLRRIASRWPARRRGHLPGAAQGHHSAAGLARRLSTLNPVCFIVHRMPGYRVASFTCNLVAAAGAAQQGLVLVVTVGLTGNAVADCLPGGRRRRPV